MGDYQEASEDGDCIFDKSGGKILADGTGEPAAERGSAQCSCNGSYGTSQQTACQLMTRGAEGRA
jgi:hypothetical protein